VVDVTRDLLERHDGSSRIDRDPGARPQALDEVQGAMEVHDCFRVHGYHRSASLDERLDVPVGLFDHEMHVERHLRDPLERSDHGRTDGQVRNEVAVHHVHVNQLGAAAFGRGYGGAKGGKISRQDRRGDEDRHLLTSSEMGSPGAI
jgi:hypothetical protein